MLDKMIVVALVVVLELKAFMVVEVEPAGLCVPKVGGNLLRVALVALVKIERLFRLIGVRFVVLENSST